MNHMNFLDPLTVSDPVFSCCRSALSCAEKLFPYSGLVRSYWEYCLQLWTLPTLETIYFHMIRSTVKKVPDL